MEARRSSIQAPPLTRSIVASWASLNDQALQVELAKHNHEFSKRFQFSDIDSCTREELRDFLSERPETSSQGVRAGLLEMIRLLARDRNGLDVLINKTVSTFVVNNSGLVTGVDVVGWQAIEQAEKCLINTLFNSKNTRDVFEMTATKGLIKRLSAFVAHDFSNEAHSFIAPLSETDRVDLWFYDLRLAFIASAKLESLQTTWREDGVAFQVFVETVVQSLAITNTVSDAEMAPPTPHLNRAAEALKTLYNILCHANGVYPPGAMSTLVPLCCAVIRRSSELGPELVQHAVNLLQTLCYSEHFPMELICPKVGGEFKGVQNEGRDMTIPSLLVRSMSDKLEMPDSSEREMVVSFFAVLLAFCSQCKEARRYCRMLILPPLTRAELERRPDEGDTLRNRMVRAIQAPACKDLAAELLFVLCKRSVQRMIKYTGFGHSAGLLANHGLLGSLNQGKERDSEDSETEEYNEVREKINPVSGFIETRPDRRPEEEMSMEQREHEAMNLVDAIDQMMRRGLIRPARIGEDGRPIEVEHVLELVRDEPERNGESDSDE